MIELLEEISKEDGNRKGKKVPLYRALGHQFYVRSHMTLYSSPSESFMQSGKVPFSVARLGVLVVYSTVVAVSKLVAAGSGKGDGV